VRTTIGTTPPMVKTSHTAYGTEVEFIDPMTARKLDTSLLPQDTIVQLTATQRLKNSAHRWLVDVPKAVSDGLKGDSSYNMGDFGLLTQVPYYLGGAFLTLSYAAGKNAPSTWQQALGVLGYYVTFAGARAAVNRLYKARYGIDFDLMYKTPDNRIENVFGSVSYPRIDLLRPQDYWQMRQKMGIPDDVASPNEAVKHQLPNILSAAWLDRMVLGNVLAAVTTGYLTRVASVKGLPQALKSLVLALRNPKTAAGLLSLATLRALLPKGGNQAAKRVAGTLGVGAPLAVVAHTMHAQTPERYQATGLPTPNMTRIQQRPLNFSAFSAPPSEEGHQP
jgi:hypothetical protein